MKRHLLAVVSVVLTLGSSLALAAEARLETRDILAYRNSLDAINAGLTQQEMVDFNWRLTVLAYGDKPASMTDEEYGIGLMTFMLEQTDTWLERLAPYDGWTADQIMALQQ
jgi:hypothetical protein